MDFGRLEDVSMVDFQLPPDQNFKFENTSPIEIFVGLPVWKHPAWVGKMYSSKAKETEWLELYAQNFNTLELNVTHYQTPDTKTTERWRSAVGNNFRFCPKFPHEISHTHMLQGVEYQTQKFVDAIQNLAENLGTCFIQLPQKFGTNRVHFLHHFIDIIPENFALNFELRHPSWFQNSDDWLSLCQHLQDKNFGLVHTDVAGRRDVLHMNNTHSTAQIRFVGYENDPSNLNRLEKWTEKWAKWTESGIRKIYVFIHNGENIFAPELAQSLVQLVNKSGMASLYEPNIKPIPMQYSLFDL